MTLMNLENDPSVVTGIVDLENDPYLHGGGLHFHPPGNKCSKVCALVCLLYKGTNIES
jgi:hypothetical protein